MTLNGVMTVRLRYFTEFGNHAFQWNAWLPNSVINPTHKSVDLWRNLCTSLLYFVLCTMSSQRKFTFASISSPDEFLVSTTDEQTMLWT